MMKLRLVVSVASFVAVVWMGGAETSATVAQMHTLPFEGQFVKTCGFGCYGGHLGTDYQLGVTSTGGHPVVASARGQT